MASSVDECVEALRNFSVRGFVYDEPMLQYIASLDASFQVWCAPVCVRSIVASYAYCAAVFVLNVCIVMGKYSRCRIGSSI